jgi:glycerol-3-phosphate dehydrogenase
MLVVGGGATGCGVALDGAMRGLKVACVERGDFASETSSRSSKLLWGGSKYIATATAQLFSWKTLTEPFTAIERYYSEMKMVLHCHQERTYMMETHPHLVNWVPLAIPFRSWIMWEPVLDHPLFMILPLIAPLFTKFYDSLSGFHCPPSYVLGPKKANEVFPQLDEKVKYCAVLHEGQHNDARTCTSIALTAALKGATIANHVEVMAVLQGGPKGRTVTGVRCKDRLTGKEFEVKAKSVVFAGGPFTDGLRKLEDADCKPAVGAGGGSHIVLPGYYSPQGMGLADLRTSRGAFLFFLPWKGHTVVGTTDTKSPAQTSPGVSEDEIQYLLNEVGRYLSDDLQVRRCDVLSAWCGWRPLAKDPHAPPNAPVSRDHLISTNPDTGVTFVTGGKWTTWREMAEHTVDRVLERAGTREKFGPCLTKTTPLIGSENFKGNLNIKLIQAYGLNADVADHLVNTYGMRAVDVCELAKPTGKRWPRFGNVLVEGFPFIEAEVEYAVGEYCRSVKDLLSLRMRLAYINSDAAKAAVPRAAELMAKKLGWSKKERAAQESEAQKYLGEFGGPVPDKFGASLRAAAKADLRALFKELDADGSGYLDQAEIGQAAEKLGFPFKTKADLQAEFKLLDANGDGKISEREFINWWNAQDGKSGLWQKLHGELNAAGDWEG